LIQINLALYTSWLVIFSRQRSRRQLWQTAAFYCGGASVVLAIMFEVARPLVEWAYSGRYLTGAWLLPIYCLAVGFNGFESVFTCFMKAIRLLRRGYAPQIIGAGISITLGYFLIPAMGSAGAIYAIVISFVIGAILALALALHES
jgi:O-antigen/teichoic acid export membrane protein